MPSTGVDPAFRIGEAISLSGSEEAAVTFVIFLLCIAPYLIFTFLPLHFQGLVRLFAIFYLFDDLHSYALSKSSL